MVKISINDYEYSLPTKWSEVTLQQYLQMDEHREQLSAVRLLSILTGLSYTTLNNLPCSDFVVKVMPKMEWLAEEFNPFVIPRSKRIKIGSYEFDRIIDIGQERLGQKLYMQQLVNAAMKDNLPHSLLVAPVVACYYAPYIHPEKQFDEKHVKEFEQLVLQSSVLEVYAEANFFLIGYIRYSSKKQRS